MQHGKDEFDKNYFGIFFKKYDKSDLDFYYRWFKGWENLLDQFIQIKNGSGKNALEIGCALGSFAKILKENGFKVVAADISKFIVGKARNLQPDLDFKVINIEEEVKIKQKFDFIFAFEVLEHLKNPKTAIKNMKKMLKNDGILVFSTPVPTTQTLADPMHINVHSPDYWIKLGKELEFNNVSFRKVAFIPFLYRFHSIFSFGFTVRFEIPFVNNTCFYFFKL